MFAKTTLTKNKFTSLKDILDFGKYNGKTIKQILDHDASYLKWAIENIDRFMLSEKDEERIYDKADMERTEWLQDNVNEFGWEDYYDYCD